MSIKIYDDLFPAHTRETIYNFAINSRFTIGNKDTYRVEGGQLQYLVSNWSEEDLKRSTFIDGVEGTEISKIFTQEKLNAIMVNLSVPSDSNLIHTHAGSKIVLYYVNTVWSPDFGGETVFYNEDLSDVERAIAFKPGRIVVFDGNLPHSIRPQNYLAPHYRMTLAMVFNGYY